MLKDFFNKNISLFEFLGGRIFKTKLENLRRREITILQKKKFENFSFN